MADQMEEADENATFGCNHDFPCNCPPSIGGSNISGTGTQNDRNDSDFAAGGGELQSRYFANSFSDSGVTDLDGDSGSVSENISKLDTSGQSSSSSLLGDSHRNFASGKASTTPASIFESKSRRNNAPANSPIAALFAKQMQKSSESSEQRSETQSNPSQSPYGRVKRPRERKLKL